MPHHQEPPIAGFDQMTVATVQQAIRSLDQGQLKELLEYEQVHADRPLVKEVITTRMIELSAGAQPSDGPPPSGPPAEPPQDRQRVRPDTQAEPIIPPSHGVPTTHRPRQGPRR